MKPENSGPDHDMTEPSFTTRNLGLIKAAAVIMGILIIVLTVVVIGTIASRLAKMSAPAESVELVLPAGAEVRSASAGEKGYVLVVDTPGGQEIWRVSSAGKRLQVISVTQE